MTKHTPGPWKQIEYGDWLYIGGDDIDFVQYDPVDEPYNYCVENAVCVIDHVDNLTEQRLANARLIAATPEFLRVCKDTLVWFAKFKITNSITFEGAPELVADIELVVASVTKEG